MSEAEGPLNQGELQKETHEKSNDRRLRGILLLVVFALAVYLIARNLSVFGNLLLVFLGFGAVVIVHEFGHFVVAKLSGIKVEAFSIFMPPTVLGVSRTVEGFRVRVLPGLSRSKDEESAGGLLNFTVGKAGKAGETEYRIGLIPFGGLVKMLGQEDVGAAESTDDPRSYASKPVGVRMAVIASGVLFNVISAAIVFVVVFLVGIKLTPPVVGRVAPDSPAAKVGLRPGDEIIEVGGRSRNIDYLDVAMAAALAGRDDEVELKVERSGKVLDFAIVPEQLPGEQLKDFGIDPPLSLTVANVSDPNKLEMKTGLLPGDRITAVDGQQVKAYWELADIVQRTYSRTIKLAAERKAAASGKTQTIESEINLVWAPGRKRVKEESDLSHVCSMVPRLRIAEVSSEPASIWLRFLSVIGRKGPRTGETGEEAILQTGDVIASVGDVANPTFDELRRCVAKYGDLRAVFTRYGVGELSEFFSSYRGEDPRDISRRYRSLAEQVKQHDELRELTGDFRQSLLQAMVTKYRNEKLAVGVLRGDSASPDGAITVGVVPRWSGDDKRWVIGILPVLDAEHPVVAKTIAPAGGPGRLDIPEGAVVTAINGEPVESFYDIAKELQANPEGGVTIDYRIEGAKAGSVVLAPDDKKVVEVGIGLGEMIFFKPLERLYKATGPVDAIVMGYNRTVRFIAQAYLTLKRFLSGLLSAKNFMGPVGIAAFSYRIVSEKPLVYYAYFLGLISALIAVFNLVPILPLDGGHILFLLVEKIKGSAVSERFQGALAYAGWILIGALFVYVTFNDVVRNFLS
jgi:membrane-associated protease RseP (regulator of RpoE activity)